MVSTKQSSKSYSSTPVNPWLTPTWYYYSRPIGHVLSLYQQRCERQITQANDSPLFRHLSMKIDRRGSPATISTAKGTLSINMDDIQNTTEKTAQKFVQAPNSASKPTPSDSDIVEHKKTIERIAQAFSMRT
ncbi:hypothetical protein Agabi119p4_6506 [Agaricus bisporus var. burnettii]|uniref:Uncharacterized protein n=1 Tax=Agaricus bisporus var. burnettii TaxID=192524 RepID=A0A8H7C8J9_AGABI|nr:hypothetical protein Agabi119p4_6506 [Agaricus bisporus var. burnettii]